MKKFILLALTGALLINCGGGATAPGNPSTNPVIDSFTASETSISSGQSTTLKWDTFNAVSVSLSNIPSGTSLKTSGSVSVSPTTTTTYTLTAKGSSGMTISSTVTVSIGDNTPKPTISSFKASPSTINKGDSSTLSWSTSDATSVTISNTTGTQGAGGTLKVTPQSTTNYLLTATGKGGTATQTLTITVNTSPPPAPAPTIQVTASPTSIQPGGSSTLSWTATNTSSVTVSGVTGSFKAPGSTIVKPTATTTYTVTATGPGGTTSATTTVKVVNPVFKIKAGPTFENSSGSALSGTWGLIGLAQIEIVFSNPVNTDTIVTNNNSQVDTVEITYSDATISNTPLPITATFKDPGKNTDMIIKATGTGFPGAASFQLRVSSNVGDTYKQALTTPLSNSSFSTGGKPDGTQLDLSFNYVFGGSNNASFLFGYGPSPRPSNGDYVYSNLQVQNLTLSDGSPIPSNVTGSQNLRGIIPNQNVKQGTYYMGIKAVVGGAESPYSSPESSFTY